MSQALQKAEDSQVLRGARDLKYQQGPFLYAVTKEGSGIWYSVTDGKETFRTPVIWSFGLGFAGQTYLVERNGKWYESRVSFYRETHQLDLTTGARRELPRSMDEAVGRELSIKGAEECFNCHASGALKTGQLNTTALTPGVQCDRCHDETREHAASFSKGVARFPKKLSAFTTDELSDYCGQCHRTWSQIATNGPHNVSNVRFQPYRLTNSKCYDVSDARIKCTTCHEPHSELVRDAAFYDTKCRACHSQPGARVCHVATRNCASCHMPKVRIEETHNAFTDHWIRIARHGDPYPN